MSKTVKWIVIAVLLVGIIVGASVLYEDLSRRYSTSNLETFVGLGGGETDSSTDSITESASEQGTSGGTDEKNSSSETADLDNQETGACGSSAYESTSTESDLTEAEETESTTSTANDDDLYAAPDFTVLDSNGNQVKLSDFKGKPIVLNFWATWCHYCKLEMPDFNKAYHKYPDVQFLMVNATDGVYETLSSAQKYIEDEGYDFDVFFDTEEEALYAYQITSFPTTFFIDKNGKLIARGSGMLDLATLEQGIQMITEDTK